MSTHQWHYVRRATAADIQDCDRIARTVERKWRGSMGWVRKDSLADGAAKQMLHVAILDNAVVGFAYFTCPSRGKNERWNVIHALAVHPNVQGRGIGRALLYSVPTPIRLLCPEFVNGNEGNPANGFYRAAGMKHAGYTDTLRTEKLLNRWEMRVLAILVMGGRKQSPYIARKAGWAYGTRASDTPYDYPIQVDIEWRDYDWTKHMQKIRDWRPVSALAADYEHPEHRDMMLQQIQDLRDAGVIRIMVCPKFPGAVADIPEDCIIAVSVPSSYAGFLPDFKELSGRRVHLLGGSPPQWLGSRTGGMATGYIQQVNAAGGLVVSADGNVHSKAAAKGLYWSSAASWIRERKNRQRPFDIYQTMTWSGVNIRAQLHEIGEMQQLALPFEVKS